jgi:SulP family sulfate permease
VVTGPIGVSRVRAVLHGVAPHRETLRQDVVAGLPGAIGSVPDGMAASVLAGVSPVYGLYASFAGPVAGGLVASSQLMVITTTSAAALAAGSALQGVPAADRPGALFLLTLLAGVGMVVAGALRLGRYVRFVPHSVMIGFLTGVAVNIICSQLPDLTGVPADGGTSVAKAIDVLVHLGEVDRTTLLVGASALALVVVLSRGPLRQVSALLALVVPSVVVALADRLDVALVSDGGAFPRGLPVPALPDVEHLSVSLLSGAIAVAVLVLVQGAGVSEAAPNPDASPADVNRDFVAQGSGNLASAMFQGMPVGGSVGQTALNVAAGARTRWASIASGLWMAVILVLLSGLVGKVALPTLAALLIFAAVGAIRPAEVVAILRTSSTSRVALVATFVATLLLPVAEAVAVGVAISLLLQLNQDALDLRVVELRPDGAGQMVERDAPDRLPSHAVTVLDVYGSLLYAGARTLQARLPEPSGAREPVVVLRMRGRTTLGATFFVVVSGYAGRLQAQGGRLYVSGVDPALADQMRRNGKVAAAGPVALYEAEPIVGASTRAAVSDAHLWLIEQDPEHADPSDPPGPRSDGG